MLRNLSAIPLASLLVMVLLLDGALPTAVHGVPATAAVATAPQPLSAEPGSSSFPVDIPGAWRLQQIGTPLDPVFIDPLHG